MSYCIAYLRVSTKDQDVDSQRELIRKHSIYKDIAINEWIELEISSRKDERLRRIHELREKLKSGDILITSELSRLGRSMVEVVQLVNDLAKAKVRVIIIHQNIDTEWKEQLEGTQKMILGIFSTLAEMERDLISLRTKEGLKIARANGKVLGRRSGIVHSSKYDKNQTKIKEMLAKGQALTAIIKELGYGRALSLSEYLARKGWRTKELKGVALKNLRSQQGN